MTPKYIIVGGEEGLSEILFRVQSYSFCHLCPHAKFQNRGLPPSGRFMVGEATSSRGYTGCYRGYTEYQQNLAGAKLGSALAWL